MTRFPLSFTLSASVALLMQASPLAAQDAPTLSAQATPAPPTSVGGPSCTALRAEVAQLERDMNRESVAMSKQANEMQKKTRSRQSGMRAAGLLSMIPGAGMLGSLVSRAAGAGMRDGMPKEMQASMDRQIALGERMADASQDLHDKCGEDHVPAGAMASESMTGAPPVPGQSAPD